MCIYPPIEKLSRIKKKESQKRRYMNEAKIKHVKMRIIGPLPPLFGFTVLSVVFFYIFIDRVIIEG